MRLVAIDDLELAELGIGVETQPALITADSDSLAFTAKRRETAEGTAFFGGSVDEAVWNMVIVAPDRARRDLLYAALLANVKSERLLVAEMDDAAATRAFCYAYVRKIVLRSETGLSVDAEAADSRWLAETVASTSKTFTAAADRRVLLEVPGNHPTKPRIWLIPTGTPKTANAYVGYRWWRRYRIANNGDVDWFREPIRIDLGSSTTNFGGKAQADGGDVRVVLNGVEQYRSLFGWGTATTWIWVIAPHIPPGGSLDYDIIYGNPAAANGPDLAYPDAPPFAMDSSTNATWNYPVDVDNAAFSGKGAWALLSNIPPATPDYDVPGAWRPARTIPNPENADSTFQGGYYDFGGSVRAMAVMRAFRAHENFQNVSYPRRNEYDGVALYSCLPVTHLNVSYRANTSAASTALFARLSRQSAADDWASFDSDVVSGGLTGGSVIAFGNSALDVPSRHIATAVWPNDRWQWYDHEPDEYIEVWWDDTLIVTRATADLSITEIRPETEIYELATAIGYGGGPGVPGVPPYQSLRIGNALGDDGAGAPRVWMPMTGSAAVVDCETFQHHVWTLNAAGAYEVDEPISAHAVACVAGWRNPDGSQGEAATSDWLPVRPRPPVVPNAGFDTGIGGIEVDTFGVAVANMAYDATRGGKQLGSLQLNLTAAMGIGTTPATLKLMHSVLFPVAGRESINLGAWLRSTNAALRPSLAAKFYGPGGLSDFIMDNSDPNGTFYAPTPDTDYEATFANPVPEGARWFRIGLWALVTVSGFTGTVWFDDITIDGSELSIRDDAVSGLTVRVDLAGTWVV